jgi:hypothetical protein
VVRKLLECHENETAFGGNIAMMLAADKQVDSIFWERVRHNGEECKIYHYEKDFYHHFCFVLLSWAVGKG